MIVFWIVFFFNFYQLTAEKKESKKWVSQQTFGTSYFDRSLLTLLCNGFEGCLVKKSLSKWTRKRCQIASKVNHATNSSTSKQCAAYKQILHGVPFMLQVRSKAWKSGRGMYIAWMPRNSLLCPITGNKLKWIIGTHGHWKIKILGALWSYLLNSTANSAYSPQKLAKWAELAVLFSW